jgi:hypothetical protein
VLKTLRQETALASDCGRTNPSELRLTSNTFEERIGIERWYEQYFPSIARFSICNAALL